MKNAINVILLGEATTGKTSIVNRLVKGTFKQQTDATVGASFISHDFRGYKFHFWDTAGQERYLSIAPIYYRKGEVIILTFDASRLHTIDRLIHYLGKLKEELQHKYEVIIVGTKTDLTQHNIQYIDTFVKEKLEQFQKNGDDEDDNGIIKPDDYIYVSSKTANNINNLLELLIAKGKIIFDEKSETHEDDGIVAITEDHSSETWLNKISCGYCI